MEKIIANNKKAFHEYFILEEIQCGIELFGTEVKSLRLGKCSIKESFVRIINNETFIMNMNISAYEKGNIFNRDPIRVRKLLLHKKQINTLYGKIKMDGFTLVPLRVYFIKGKVKVDIGLAKGKKLYDKRQDIAKRDKQREARRELKMEFRK